MTVRTNPGVRLLPNAITVLALCAGLSAVQFALTGNYAMAIASIGIAAVLDSLDGRIARMLDASSKMGAELDSLADGISFGVAPALVLYVWHADGERIAWLAALVFAVCMILRLARFNTLLDTEQPPYANEFFVGVPAPAGGLLALMPMTLTLQFGEGWWSSQPVVWVWTAAVAALLISRIPTYSLKSVKVPSKAVGLLLVGVGVLASTIILFPLIALAAALLLYLVHVPFAVRRYRWLARHPEAWDVPAREQRRIRRARSSARRLGLRRPLRRQVAGVAGAARRAVRRNGSAGGHEPRTPGDRRRSWRRIGLRQRGGGGSNG